MTVTHDQGCACYQQIASHVTEHPGKMILPRPTFCEDAALIAWALDARLEACQRQRAQLRKAYEFALRFPMGPGAVRSPVLGAFGDFSWP